MASSLQNCNLQLNIMFQVNPRMRGYPKSRPDPEADQGVGHRLRSQSELQHEEGRTHRLGCHGHRSRKSNFHNHALVNLII